MKKLISWALLLACAGSIFYLSSLSSLPIPTRYSYQDKVEHFLAYFALAWLAGNAFELSEKKKSILAAFAFACAYGISDEFHQSLVPGRDASAWDWLADSLGGMAGALAHEAGKRRIRH